MQIGSFTIGILDLVILGICIIWGIVGCLRGFLGEFSHTAGLLCGAFCGLLFTHSLYPIIGRAFPNFPQVIASYLCFLSLTLLGYVTARLIGRALDNLVDAMHLSAVDTILGFFYDFLFAAFFISMIIYILSLQHLYDFSPIFDSSAIITRFIKPLLPETLRLIKGVANA